MSSDTEPLLVDAPPGEIGNAPPQHFCARCSSELEAHQQAKEHQPWTLRHGLIIVAVVLSLLIFIFSIVEMSTAPVFRSPSILQIFVTLWADVTITFLALLLYLGRRRQSVRNLSRTVSQIRVLCALAFSWIIFMVAMLCLNPKACDGWESEKVICGLFTTIHVLTWLLIIILFWAAYATYRRAVSIHGTNMVAVPTPRLVAAWRLSNIAEEEGAIKI